MPIITRQFSLAQDTPVMIVGADNMTQEVHIHNSEAVGTRDLYIGGDNTVSDSNGHHVWARSDIRLVLAPGDVLWGMTPDSAGCNVTVLQIQKND
jgi:hypothetical protein